MSARERRKAALSTKLSSLDGEVADWSKLPASNPAFTIHSTQLENLCGSIAAMKKQIEDGIAELAEQRDLTYEDVIDFERQILAALQIWQCYRDKFAVRWLEGSRAALTLLDDLAWAAYRVTRDQAVSAKAIEALDVREPPLVFPTARWSPFARSREDAYRLEEETGTTVLVEGFDRWLDKLPIPLVGVPWYQLSHLPEGVFVGHELGHVIEGDLGLDEPLRVEIARALTGAPPERLEAWSRRWRSEVFADVYGVLTTGSAYARILLDLLALDQEGVAGEAQPNPKRPQSQQWGDYPTRVLRARVVCEAVRQLPSDKPNEGYFRALAAELEASSGIPNAHAMAAYEPDVSQVVAAMLSASLAPLAGPLVDVFGFTAAMDKQARTDAKAANSSSAVDANDIRTLFAGVAHAFADDPLAFTKTQAQKRFQQRMLGKRSQAPRNIETKGFVPVTSAKRQHRAATLVLDLVKKTPGN